MTALESLASQPELQKLGLTLLHFLWQGGAVALLAAVAVFTLRLNQGGQRYTAYLLAMIIMAACPIVTYRLIEAPRAIAAPPVLAASPLVEGLPGTIEVNRIPPTPATIVEREADPQALLRRALPWVLGAWSVGVALLSLRLSLGVLGVRRWKRSAEDLPPHLRAIASALASRLGLDGFTGVYFSRLVRQAVAVGCWRPMVLLPASMITGMGPDLLEAVIAHELAHIRRKDLWVNSFQRLAETLLFYHPAVWWVSARIREEREMCCDDLAVAATGKRIEYASALAEAGRCQIAPAGTLALGIRGGGGLLHRVQRVLGVSDQGRRTGWPAGVAAMAIVLMVTAFAGLSRRATAQNTAAADANPRKPAADPEEASTDLLVSLEVRADPIIVALTREILACEVKRDLLLQSVAPDAPAVRHLDMMIAVSQRKLDVRRAELAASFRDQLQDRYVEEQLEKDALITALRQQQASTEVQRILAEAQGSGPDAAAYQRLSTALKLLADRLAHREDEIRKHAEDRWHQRQKQGANPISFTPPGGAAAGPTTPPATHTTRRRTDAESDLKESRIKLEIARVQVTKRQALLEQAKAGGIGTEIRIAEAELKQAELEAELIKLNLERAERALNQ